MSEGRRKRKLSASNSNRRKSARLSKHGSALHHGTSMAANSRGQHGNLSSDTPDTLLRPEQEQIPTDQEFPQVVDLNVGGRHLSTSLATLTKYPESMLAAMFSGRHSLTKDKDGRYFIDVDGDLFVYILNFLRLETLPPPEMINEVKKLAEYFGIEELTERLNDLEPSSEEALFAMWASEVNSYPVYLKQLRDEIHCCEITGGFVYIQLTQELCMSENCNHTIDLINYVNTDYAKRRCNIINVDVDTVDAKEMKTLLTLLAHDVKKIGLHVFAHEEPLVCPCKLAKKFKVDSCIEKQDVRRLFV